MIWNIENIEMSFMQIAAQTNSLRSQRGDFLLKTEELFPARCLFRFQSGAGPFFTSSSKQNRLPEALGGRQTGKSLTQNDAKLLFKGIQQNWTRMMADNGGIQTSRFALDAKNAEFSGSCCKDLQRLRILYEGVTGGRVLSNLQSFYLSPDKMDLKQIS